MKRWLKRCLRHDRELISSNFSGDLSSIRATVGLTISSFTLVLIDVNMLGRQGALAAINADQYEFQLTRNPLVREVFLSILHHDRRRLLPLSQRAREPIHLVSPWLGMGEESIYNVGSHYYCIFMTRRHLRHLFFLQVWEWASKLVTRFLKIQEIWDFNCALFKIYINICELVSVT